MSQSDLAASSTSKKKPDGNKQLLPAGLVCPSCNSDFIRRSMRRSFKDYLLSLLGRWPYRCELCNMRFNGPQDPVSFARENGEPDPTDSALAEDAPAEKRQKPKS